MRLCLLLRSGSSSVWRARNRSGELAENGKLKCWLASPIVEICVLIGRITDQVDRDSYFRSAPIPSITRRGPLGALPRLQSTSCWCYKCRGLRHLEDTIVMNTSSLSWDTCALAAPPKHKQPFMLFPLPYSSIPFSRSPPRPPSSDYSEDVNTTLYD